MTAKKKHVKKPGTPADVVAEMREEAVADIIKREAAKPASEDHPAARRFKVFADLREMYRVFTLYGTPGFVHLSPEDQNFYSRLFEQDRRTFCDWVKSIQEAMLGERLDMFKVDREQQRKWIVAIDLMDFRLHRDPNMGYVRSELWDDDKRQRLNEIVEEMYPLCLQLKAAADAERSDEFDAKVQAERLRMKGGKATSKRLPKKPPVWAWEAHRRWNVSRTERPRQKDIVKEINKLYCSHLKAAKRVEYKQCYVSKDCARVEKYLASGGKPDLPEINNPKRRHKKT